jgi:hypothetical protein
MWNANHRQDFARSRASQEGPLRESSRTLGAGCATATATWGTARRSLALASHPRHLVLPPKALIHPVLVGHSGPDAAARLCAPARLFQWTLQKRAAVLFVFCVSTKVIPRFQARTGENPIPNFLSGSGFRESEPRTLGGPGKAASPAGMS